MFRRTSFVVLLGFLLLVPFLGLAAAEEENSGRSSSTVLQNAVMGAAGTSGQGGLNELRGTLGQPTPIGIGAAGNTALHAGFWSKISVMTSVLDRVVPGVFRNTLFSNVPNPFNPTTTIRYEIGEESPVSIVVYSIQGRRIRTLVSETRRPGRYEVVWDGRSDQGTSVASGVYLYRIQIGRHSSVKKMILVR